MIGIELIRNNKDLVKERLEEKFGDQRLLLLVDKAYLLDQKSISLSICIDRLRSDEDSLSSRVDALINNGKREEVLPIKEQMGDIENKIAEFENEIESLSKDITRLLILIELYFKKGGITFKSASNGELGGILSSPEPASATIPKHL
jgi:seryl-tRNA synthetase